MVQLSPELAVDTEQRLALTPFLRQSLSILQMSIADLEMHISEQLQENPVLDQEENPELEDIFNHAEMEQRQSLTVFGGVNNPDLIETMNPKASTLYGSLIDQLSLLDLSSENRNVAEYLVGNIDANGYLCCSPEEVQSLFGVSSEVIESMINLVHRLEPVGIGARNLEECLFLQLESKIVPEHISTLAKLIVEDYLENLARNNLVKISDAIGRSVKEVQIATDLIKSLNPKPGLDLGEGSYTPFIIPDVVVLDREQEYFITIMEPGSSRLFINPFYVELIRSAEACNKDAVAYIKDKVQAATQLIQCIERRKSTLYQVTQVIIEQQKEFWQKGVSHLKPLTLADVAKALDMNISTVSRATSGKYLQTPRGTYSFAYFFASGLSSKHQDVSSTSVKNVIKGLIDSEEPKKPLSDAKLTETMAKDGIKVSRRTVTKYREELGIPSSRHRKRY